MIISNNRLHWTRGAHGVCIPGFPGPAPVSQSVKPELSARLMKRLLLSAVLGAVCFSAAGQGTFRNMDFELARIPQNQPWGFVPADQAFPFWTVYYGTTPQTQVVWRTTSVGTTEASLLGQFPADSLGGPTAIDGGYCASLIGGGIPGIGPVDCSISQVGQIPTGAASLLFKEQPGAVPNNPITVTIGGVSLPVFLVANFPNQYAVFGVNCSQFAGLQEELRFTAPSVVGAGYGLDWQNIDDIVFSSTPISVPEPSPLGLAGLGLAGVLVLRRRIFIMSLLNPSPQLAPGSHQRSCWRQSTRRSWVRRSAFPRSWHQSR